jgi:hypothetical protein
VRKYYEAHGASYVNPHEPRVRRALAAAIGAWPLDLTSVFDLAAGGGEVTRCLLELGHTNIDAADPFTGDLYTSKTGRQCLTLGFEDIAIGGLAGKNYATVICSYAMHLPAPSRLPRLLWALREVADALLILSPHKRPVIRPAWGWTLAGSLYESRVRVRYYRPA